MDKNFNKEELTKAVLFLFDEQSKNILENNLRIKTEESIKPFFFFSGQANRSKWLFKFMYKNKNYPLSTIVDDDMTKEDLANRIAKRIESKTNWELKIKE